MDSTNDFAKSIIENDNVLVLTDHQASGKGRFNRKWESDKGRNLTFTIVKKFKLEPDSNQLVNFFTSYFLLTGIKSFMLSHIKADAYIQLGIKWPNDILLNSKKISGILIEHNQGKKTFVIGVGVNVNQLKFNPEYSEKTSSLRNFLGERINLNELLIEIIQNFDKYIHLVTKENYDTLYNLWYNSNLLIGNEVIFSENDSSTLKAKFVDLQRDGSIKLQIDKSIKIYTSGDIRILSFTGDNYYI
jgi:BirA family biotin operon repressor/biotin-[acetyl-CoA-carboxylase] ligase